MVCPWKPIKSIFAFVLFMILLAAFAWNKVIFFSISISSFEKAFQRAVKSADIIDFHMHDLRHCGAQHLIEDEGWNTIELMQQGGWTSASMAKRYANISPKYLAKKFGN